MAERIYVCEWVKKDSSLFDNDDEYAFLTSYDYTYHDSLEQAKNTSTLYWKGYSLAKGIISDLSDSFIEKPIHKKIHCECIWIYEDYIALGRYVMQNKKWIFDAYCNQWNDNWQDMLTIPAPIINL